MLHVTNGDSVSSTLDAATLGGEALAWRESLHEGPVPDVPLDELRRLRAQFLGSCGPPDARTVQTDLRERHRSLEHAVATRRPVVLWFEHDLFDQLLLLQVLALIADAGPHDPKLVEIVQVDSFPGRPRFAGLGELRPAELESLWPLRQPVSVELAELGRAIWKQIRAPEPAPLESVAGTPQPELPFLAAALRRLLQELPSTANGLSRSAQQVLAILGEGPATPAELFGACSDREEAPYEGDTWAFRRIEHLAREPAPLIRAVRGETGPGFARRPFELTEAGRAVLTGETDAVALRGIDRWLLGIHLRSGNVWRWDPGGSRAVRETGPRR